MKMSIGFGDEKLKRVFETAYAQRRVTAARVSDAVGLSAVSASRILNYLTEREFLSRQISKSSVGRGRRPAVYSIGPKVSALIYDMRGNEIVVYLYSLNKRRSKKLLFRYKNKRSSESKLDFFIRAQNTLIKNFTDKKLVIGTVCLIDGYFDEENDKIVSKSFKGLSELPFSCLGFNRANTFVIDYGELIRSYLSDAVKGERILFAEFSASRKNVYLFENGRSAVFASVDDIQKIPALDGFSLNDITRREENICNILNLFYRIYKPDTVCVSSPFIDTASTFQIREKFYRDASDTGFDSSNILFIDSAAFDLEGAAVSYIINRLPASALKGKDMP